MRFWLKLAAIGLASAMAQLTIDAGCLLFAFPTIVGHCTANDEAEFLEVEARLDRSNPATRWLVRTYLGYAARPIPGR